MVTPAESDSRPQFLLEPFEPAYLALHRSGQLGQRVEAAMRHLQECSACPRSCRVSRVADETGFCGTGRYARVASAGAHFGEEDCLRGTRGSGTIFFALCNLHCVFCQNWDISQRGEGRTATAEEIANIMLALQQRGCHNINFVTPEHVVPQVIEAAAAAIERGLRLPIVYNTSAYDSVESLRLLDGIMDIYMPDFKFWRSETSERLSHAADYPQRAREAIREMHRQVGPLKFDRNGVARRGVLVRHLVMPGQLDETREIFRFLAEEVSRDTFVNIMAQYHPDNEVGATGDAALSDINRRPTPEEIAQAYEAARAAGLWRFDPRC
jgi:putative pyruvate formate lyase activating enzyme